MSFNYRLSDNLPFIEIEALKTYKSNTTEFNAYAYYMNNADLQTAIGANGDKILEHYTSFGKAEGRIAK